MKRKDFISSSVLATAGLAFPYSSMADPKSKTSLKMKICIFSKQLQWLDYKDLIPAVAGMGYDGIDLTVRPNGHVLPERVTEDLPKVVHLANAAGIKVYMISTDIEDASSPYAETILKTTASLGIQCYRCGGINYEPDMDLPANLDKIKAKFASLEGLNRKYGLHCDFLNHSGEVFGAALWDLWFAVRDLDPKYVGCQFDIKHATIDGPFSWPVTLKLLHNYVQTICIRDFKWIEKNKVWEIQPMPLGKGAVDFRKYCGLLKEYNIQGPVSLMCDYDLGGAQNGDRKLTIPGDEVFKAMKNDLVVLRRFFDEAGI
ncbi:MAG TPA: TIM barrel protein [Flavisolibacter sp.]|jgi:sugar phosphate isomerase/epimerase|nr:TIM barrel protein [Flavisolibacter sp.]